MVTTTTIQDVLRERFGFDDFRAGQEAVIERLLGGRSVLAIFPTGAGKSICYQLPALMMDGVTLVISPLIALMKDQIDFLKSKSIAAERLDSTLEIDEYRRVMNELQGGRLKLLYIAPERLGSERFLQTLKRLNISMMAVDEAHCISEWGHNFRPDYMKLARLARELGIERVLGLTATATPSVAEDIARAFGIVGDDVIRTEFHRKNLVLRVTPVAERASRQSLLLERLRSHPPGPTIVYVTLQKTAEEVADFLAKSGLQARAYHAGMDAEDRHRVQDEFMASDRAIVVATIAFGMGIDKRDIRYVYHYNLPKSLENYAQEIGRAGRDGKESTCEILAAAGDRIVLENFTYGDTPTPRALHELLTDLFNGEGIGQNGQFDVSIYDLSGAHDIRPLVVETALTYLELDGLIASTGPFYQEYKLQLLRPSPRIQAKFDTQRQAFLKTLLSCAQPGKSWLKLDLQAAEDATGAPRSRVIAALNYLEEQGDLKLQIAGARQGYRMLRRDCDPKPLTQTMADRFAQRERRDLERMQSVLSFVNHDGCRTRHLLSYFGEDLQKSCGHCDACMGQRAGMMKDIPPRQLTQPEREIVRRLKSERHAALSTPRQMTRFLCGISSPATTRAKLKNHEGFALLEDVPFAGVLAGLTDSNK
jgi:ATP-dependent DNA helicase RecQ